MCVYVCDLPLASLHMYAIGIYSSDSVDDGQELFVAERNSFHDLCTSLVRHCSSCYKFGTWKIASMKQVEEITLVVCI